MKTIQVYDPPMCCSSGVCGAEVDSNLVNFAVSLQWLGMNGIQVERFNPLHQYDMFATHATRTAWLPWQSEEPTGPDALARLAVSSLKPALS